MRNTITSYAWLLVVGWLFAPTHVTADRDSYRLDIEADFRGPPEAGCAPVSVTVRQDRWLLRELDWAPTDTMSDLRADGLIERVDGRWRWELPADGGTLHYCLTIDDRNGERFVARWTEDWVLMRGDDLFPAVRSRTLKGAESETTLAFRLPQGWSSATRYVSDGDDRYRIEDADRRLDRPTGWMTLGRIGVRRDRLAGIRVAVAGPVNQGVRRLDLLTMMGFVLPEFTGWFENTPERLLVVAARDRMWRGALSGPGSLYLHADRPLVSENGTSPLLHELVHVFMQRDAVADEDWIDEGLAEYLGLVVLYESGGITRDRFEQALEWQAEWASESDALGGGASTGPQTARAVGVFAALHDELGDDGFREFVRAIAAPGDRLDRALLRQQAEAIHGQPVVALPSQAEPNEYFDKN